jgi:hypothetical protein
MDLKEVPMPMPKKKRSQDLSEEYHKLEVELQGLMKQLRTGDLLDELQASGRTLGRAA